jgi:hypothetical protein
MRHYVIAIDQGTTTAATKLSTISRSRSGDALAICLRSQSGPTIIVESTTCSSSSRS